MKHDAIFKQWRTPIASAVIGLVLATAASSAAAMALGSIHVRSNLGEALSADVEVTSLTPAEVDGLRVNLADAPAYEAAGLERSSALVGAEVSLQHRADGRPYLHIAGLQPVNDPFIDVLIQTDNPESGRATRGYTILIDPPAGTVKAPARVMPPVLNDQRAKAAPPTAAPVATSTAPAADEDNAASQAAAVKGNKTAPKEAAKSASNGKEAGKDVRVKHGDTAGGIARQLAAQEGVSFDQMLAALLRSNPDAFIGGNVNRIKAGVVLQAPSADEANSVSKNEAKHQWVASSRNFKEYRRRLSQVSSARVGEQAGRSESGSVESQVSDQSSPVARDKLTLGKARSHRNREEQIMKNRRHAESSARVSELSKNIEDLKKLSAKAETPVPVAAAATAKDAKTAGKAGAGMQLASPLLTAKTKVEPTATAAPTLAPSPTAAHTATAAPSAAAAASAAASAATSASAAAASVAASAPAAVASAAQGAASAAAAAASSVVNATKPKIVISPFSNKTQSGGLMDQLGDLLLPLGGLAAALGLGGLGYAVYRKRKAKGTGVDSAAFLESKLEADSFFDASGGQRVDTASRPGGISSSMVYSPSQLDAAGDVDPVAEAGVYMAYNRDQQAEDILKEAMRITPSRVAIYTTLMEIYAKRGDLKAFDVVAREAHHLTGGQGEEWAKAAELGQQMEPNNPMYGGKGEASTAGHDEEEHAAAEPVAYSRPAALPTAPMSLDQAQSAAKLEDADLDMVFRNSDFKLPEEGEGHAQHADQATHIPTQLATMPAPIAAAVAPAAAAPKMDLDFDMDSAPAPAAPSAHGGADALFTEESLSGQPSAHGNEPLKFDMSDLSLDLSSPAAAVEHAAVAVTGGAEDPWTTKLELAREFVGLGDTDGARAMAEEVIAHAPAAVADKARTLIATLV